MRDYYTKKAKFRNYQQTVSSLIDLAEKNNESSVICQPTGTGKSVILIDRALRWVTKGHIVAIIVPSFELVQNIEKYIKSFAPDIYKFFYSPICSKLPFNSGKRIYVSTYQSFMKRYEKMSSKPTHFIHDEAHHCKSKTWEAIAKLPGFHLAFTATPLRLDGRSLSDLFPGFIDAGHDVSWFIENGYLSDFEIKSTFTVEFEKQRGIDNLKYQAQKLDKRELLGNVVDEWKKHAYGRKTIVFTTGNEHSRHVLEEYTKAGISACVMSATQCYTIKDGKTVKIDRESALDGFKGDKYTVIINVAILVEGVDVPNATCVQLVRFTNSVPLYFQMIGRILRPSALPGIILDHAGNVEHHMSPDCPIDWKELYYAQVDMGKISEFDPFIRCVWCDKPILKKSERKELKFGITCKYCDYENIIEPIKKREEIKIKKGELLDFKMSRSEQLIYKIYTSDKPHQIKVKNLLKSLNVPGITEKDVRRGLGLLYANHPMKDVLIDQKIKLFKSQTEKEKLRKKLNI